VAKISYTVVAVLQHTCKCAVALPTSKMTFVIEAESGEEACKSARRMLRHMTKARVLAVDATKARWEE